MLLSRLPFLCEGYGNDWDAWRVVSAGQHLLKTGEYVFSRQPGSPLQEAIGALVAGQDYWVGSLVTAVSSAIAAVLFLLILRFYGVRDAVLGALALAFTPILYVESMGMMDYVLALTCILGATYATLTGRLVAAAALLGMATDFRASSALPFVPLAAFLFASPDYGQALKPRLWQVARLAGISGGVALLAFALPLATYGTGLLDSYQKMHRDWAQAAWIATVGVFGIPGVLAVAAGLAVAARGRLAADSGAESNPATSGGHHPLLWLLAAAMPVAVYVWQPSEAAYFIPAVPFVLLIIAKFASRRVFVLVCAALCVSPFVGQFTPWVAHAVPSLHVYQQTRVTQMRRMDALWETLSSREGTTLVIGGGYVATLRMTLPDELSSRVRLVSWVLEEDLRLELPKGTQLLCYAEACGWNAKRTGFDPVAFGVPVFSGD